MKILHARWKTLGVLLMIGMVSCGDAAAEAVQGKVVAVDSKGQFITVEPTAGDTAGRQNIQLRFSPEAQLRGARSFDEIQVGDEIQGQVSRNGGVWSVQSLQRRDLNQTGQTSTTPGQTTATFGQRTTTTSGAFKLQEDLPRTGMPGTSQGLESTPSFPLGEAHTSSPGDSIGRRQPG